MNPQDALDAPRFRWDEGKKVALETYFDDDIAEQLRKKGHDIKIDPVVGGFGRGQIILNKKDHYEIGTETRCNGHIAYR
jgi:gamma-glutamyltranspeptidase/glutathione hydrolase